MRQITTDANNNFARRRAVRETVLLGAVFLIALFLFFTTVHFIATREAAYELKDRPRGLILGWLTAMAIGLVVGKTRHEEGMKPPKSLVVVRHSLQALMLLLFCGVLSYAAYFLYTVRGLALQRPWSLLIGWFAVLVFIAICGKIRQVVQVARQK